MLYCQTLGCKIFWLFCHLLHLFADAVWLSSLVPGRYHQCQRQPSGHRDLSKISAGNTRLSKPCLARSFLISQVLSASPAWRHRDLFDLQLYRLICLQLLSSLAEEELERPVHRLPIPRKSWLSSLRVRMGSCLPDLSDGRPVDLHKIYYRPLRTLRNQARRPRAQAKA